MARYILAIALVIAAASAATAIFSPGKTTNNFMVRYNIIPDPFHSLNFFHMPRNMDAAFKDNWSLEYTDYDDQDVQVHCRKGDHRVCLLFDRYGNIAGIRLSVKVEELKNIPMDIAAIPEWKRWTMFEHGEVYSATVLFQPIEQIHKGGRAELSTDSLTIPSGIWIEQSTKDGEVTGFLHVPNEESKAETAGFREQACFLGMGKHYFQELTPESKCDSHRPFFMLYGPKGATANELVGFGFTMWGKPTAGRGWFESPSATVAKMIAPNSPQCLSEYIDEYGMFTMHVYFIDKPYYIKC